jgi:hypothetical protein
MQHATYVSVKHMGPGEWVGQCLRRIVQANEDRPVLATNTPTDWRFDWRPHTENRHRYREFRFE